MSDQRPRDRTIQDFGEQWQRYRDNEGYYGGLDLFEEILRPLMTPGEFRGKTVADIGGGSGRIVRWLAQSGAARIVAVEPSAAMEVLKENTREWADRIDYLQCPGDELDREDALDLIVSIGVLHHIPDPAPVVAACYKALKPGGRMLAWLYGKEGNGLYLAVFQPLRWITCRMPSWMLSALAWALVVPATLYVWMCRALPLPMRDYAREVFGRFSPSKRQLVIYDQLNPYHAKYYKRDEARALLADAGFVDVQAHHRQGYSWTVVGTKPAG